jgi:hypothetical protein
LLLDGKIDKKQIKVPKRDIPDERHDETCKKKTIKRKLYQILRSGDSATQRKTGLTINVKNKWAAIS